MGGGGKTKIDALARASGRSPPHGGVYFPVSGTRGQSLWCSREGSLGDPERMAPLRRREADGGPARAISAPAGVGQWERQECLGVSSGTPRPQERWKRRTERVHQKLPRSAWNRSWSWPGWAGTTGPVCACG